MYFGGLFSRSLWALLLFMGLKGRADIIMHFYKCGGEVTQSESY